MGNRLYIGEKHNGYEIDEESKKLLCISVIVYMKM